MSIGQDDTQPANRAGPCHDRPAHYRIGQNSDRLDAIEKDLYRGEKGKPAINTALALMQQDLERIDVKLSNCRGEVHSMARRLGRFEVAGTISFFMLLGLMLGIIWNQFHPPTRARWDGSNETRSGPSVTLREPTTVRSSER